MGIGAALREGALSRNWFDGLAYLEEMVAAMMYRVNAQRADEAAIRNLSRRRGPFGG